MIGKTIAKVVVGSGLLGMLLTYAGAEGNGRPHDREKDRARAVVNASFAEPPPSLTAPVIPTPTPVQ